jgi:hypothetical protein
MTFKLSYSLILLAGVARCWNQLLQGISDLARMIEECESGSAATNVVGVAESGRPMLSRHYIGRGDGHKAA